MHGTLNVLRLRVRLKTLNISLVVNGLIILSVPDNKSVIDALSGSTRSGNRRSWDCYMCIFCPWRTSKCNHHYECCIMVHPQMLPHCQNAKKAHTHKNKILWNLNHFNNYCVYKTMMQNSATKLLARVTSQRDENHKTFFLTHIRHFCFSAATALAALSLEPDSAAIQHLIDAPQWMNAGTIRWTFTGQCQTRTWL